MLAVACLRSSNAATWPARARAEHRTGEKPTFSDQDPPACLPGVPVSGKSRQYVRPIHFAVGRSDPSSAWFEFTGRNGAGIGVYVDTAPPLPRPRRQRRRQKVSETRTLENDFRFDWLNSVRSQRIR